MLKMNYINNRDIRSFTDLGKIEVICQEKKPDVIYMESKSWGCFTSAKIIKHNTEIGV